MSLGSGVCSLAQTTICVCTIVARDGNLPFVTSRMSKIIGSKKYGCALARYTHHKNGIIHASTQQDGIFYSNLQQTRCGIYLYTTTSISDILVVTEIA